MKRRPGKAAAAFPIVDGTEKRFISMRRKGGLIIPYIADLLGRDAILSCVFTVPVKCPYSARTVPVQCPYTVPVGNYHTK